ncbi:hypothetical protein [Natranaerofaba carboxydovora]|uniref:hypothetical protein n=1 Tax=Natranaerofaba carboxydovora TaxID=2742683 RepID=UPI001F13573D|nr:hypothetical protein [Natranaerofaba carboxydovora]
MLKPNVPSPAINAACLSDQLLLTPSSLKVVSNIGATAFSPELFNSLVRYFSKPILQSSPSKRPYNHSAAGSPDL